MATTHELPYSNTREEGAFRFLGVPTLIRSATETTRGAFGLVEHWEMPVGFASPYHTHHREDESFYVLEGEVAFVCGGRWLKAGPGTFVYGPREIAHGFKVIGGPARMLLVATPGGFEGFVLEQTTPLAEPPSPPDMGRLMALAEKYGIDIHGPLPEGPEGFLEERSGALDLKCLNHRWIQAFNDRDWTTESAIRAGEFRAHLSGIPVPLDHAAWSHFMAEFTAAFPDSRIAIESCVAEGDTVSTRWTLTGTHQGMFQGLPPTGRTVQFTGLEFNKVQDGKFVEHWSMFDNLALLRQIGAMPE